MDADTSMFLEQMLAHGHKIDLQTQVDISQSAHGDRYSYNLDTKTQVNFKSGFSRAIHWESVASTAAELQLNTDNPADESPGSLPRAPSDSLPFEAEDLDAAAEIVAAANRFSATILATDVAAVKKVENMISNLLKAHMHEERFDVNSRFCKPEWKKEQEKYAAKSFVHLALHEGAGAGAGMSTLVLSGSKRHVMEVKAHVSQVLMQAFEAVASSGVDVEYPDSWDYPRRWTKANKNEDTDTLMEVVPQGREYDDIQDELKKTVSFYACDVCYGDKRPRPITCLYRPP